MRKLNPIAEPEEYVVCWKVLAGLRTGVMK